MAPQSRQLDTLWAASLRLRPLPHFPVTHAGTRHGALSKKEDPAHERLSEYRLLPHQRCGELTAGTRITHRERRTTAQT